MKNNVFKKGFTLIELMIVIVILGVLMGTILPRLTGAQARARDTGRIADLNTIGQALETYFDDNGQYPGTSGTIYCLATTDGGDEDLDAIVDDLGSYLKGGLVPKPAASQKTRYDDTENTCNGTYVYIPLANRGIDNNGYALITDVETYQKANILATDLAGITDTAAIGTALEGTTAELIKAAEEGDTADASETVYVVYN